MYVKPKQLTELVGNYGDAHQVIVELLQKFSSMTAWNRVEDEARFAHQSTDEIVSRTVSNLLTSFVTRKPGGEVF